MTHTEKKSLQSLASKLFTLEPEVENLELVLSQQVDYRKEILFSETNRHNSKNIRFEIFSDEIY